MARSPETASATNVAHTPPPIDSDPIPPSTPEGSGPHLERMDTPGSSPSLRPTLSWKSFRSSMSISEKTAGHLGWAIALLSVMFTIIALSPAFKSQDMSEKALKLAEWTALKDYIEECREELAAGIQSPACLKAMDATLPPPPYVKPGLLDKLKRSLVYIEVEYNATSRGPQIIHREIQVPAVIQGMAFLAVVLTACVFLFLSFENNRSRIRRRAYADHPLEIAEEKLSSPSPPSPPRETETVTTTVRYPPQSNGSSLRRRNVRVHPIYRHAGLEEAFHHQDLAEIRLRLQNGEDVNQHWPYLIYKLAITPPTVDTPKHLEIAQLCLDYGADVNVLKGWNGQSALMIAIHFGNVDVAKLLILNGAMVCYSPPDSNLTALHRCVRLAVTGPYKDAIETMKLLFEYGANPNQIDPAGETALHKLLIDASLKRNNQACIKRLIPVALCLLEHGAHLPRTIEKRYVIGNPLWDVVNSAVFKTEWPEHVGPDQYHFSFVGSCGTDSNI